MPSWTSLQMPQPVPAGTETKSPSDHWLKTQICKQIEIVGFCY